MTKDNHSKTYDLFTPDDKAVTRHMSILSLRLSYRHVLETSLFMSWTKNFLNFVTLTLIFFGYQFMWRGMCLYL